MVDVTKFVEECRAVADAPDAQARVADLVDAVVRRPTLIEEVLAGRRHPGPHLLYRGDDLTVYCVRARTGEAVPPHDHLLWSVAGMCSGEEEHVLYTRDGDRIVRDRVLTAAAGEVFALDAHAIHASRDSGPSAAVAVHVYGGDLFAAPRSVWDEAGMTPTALGVLGPGSIEEAQARVDASVHAIRVLTKVNDD